MTDDPLPLILARWVLDDLSPEDVPQLAVDALLRGCESINVAVIAGLTRPTRDEVDEELRALLRELEQSLPSDTVALKLVVDEVAGEIVNGTVTPHDGARRICTYAVVAIAEPEQEKQLAQFEFLASRREWDPYRSADDDAEIVSEARTLLERGGLAITE